MTNDVAPVIKLYTVSDKMLRRVRPFKSARVLDVVQYSSDHLPAWGSPRRLRTPRYGLATACHPNL